MAQWTTHSALVTSPAPSVSHHRHRDGAAIVHVSKRAGVRLVHHAPRLSQGQGRRHGVNVHAKAFYVPTAPQGQREGGGDGSGLTPPTWLNGALNVGALALAGAAAGNALASHGNPVDLYTASVAADPVGTKAVVSGTVYFLGDLIAQSWGEGRSAAEWDRVRALRSGAVGFLAHGPLSHCYYLALDSLCQAGPLASANSWALLLVKIGIDQTVWSLCWNSLYCSLLGVLKLESPSTIAANVRTTAWPLLKAGWRLWPLAHVITYGLIPLQHRLLFVDAVELAWVAIMSLACAAGQAPAAVAAAAAPCLGAEVCSEAEEEGALALAEGTPVPISVASAAESS